MHNEVIGESAEDAGPAENAGPEVNNNWDVGARRKKNQKREANVQGSCEII